MTYTLAITTHNRLELLKESFAKVLDDPRIDEILILDDASEWAIYEKVNDLTNLSDKIRVFRQAQNRGMSQNKADAVAFSKNEWVILFDSDNVLKADYIDALPGYLDPDTIYLPSFAWPNFNYTKFEGWEVNAGNVAEFIKDDQGNMCLNTCNYVVHRDTYGEVYQHNPKMKGTDTLWFAKLWVEAGKRFLVVPGMTYFHRVHKNSGFMADAHYNMDMGAKLRKLIMGI